MMPAHELTPSVFLLEALSELRSPRGGSRLSKTDPLRSAAGFRGFLHCSWGTFPRITLIHDEWKHPEEKKKEKEVPLASIQQPRPLISAGTAHNEKGRPALTSSTGLCNKGTMTIDNISWCNVDCLICVCSEKHFKYLRCFQTTFLCHTEVITVSL